MSDTKWTPGPWFRCDAELREQHSQHGWFVKVAPQRVVSVEGRTSDEADANAHLIAAAPNMADALRQWQHAEETGDERELQNARHSRDAALAQARGEQS